MAILLNTFIVVQGQETDEHDFDEERTQIYYEEGSNHDQRSMIMHVRTAIASSVAIGALVLLVTSSDAQTVSNAAGSVKSSHDRTSKGSADDNAIRPFHIKVPEEALVDLRRRLAM